MYIRKQDCYTENKVFEYLDMNDFEAERFDMVRKIVKLNRADHPWADMTNEEILVSARMKLKDIHTGKEGYTLAAALLFGTENTLASVLPHYKTDALCRKVDTELYDDRDDIRCNLLGAYYRLLDFIHKHLLDRVCLEGNQRVSVREMIFREVVVNLLVHREFSNAYPATITIFKDTVVTENWNRPYMSGLVSLETLKPHPKNPIIASFFKQLGWVEELGSGVRKMYKYCPLYVKGATPIIEDGDVFKLTIRHEMESDTITEGVSEGVSEGVNENEKQLLNLIRKSPSLSAPELSKMIGKSLATTERYLSAIRKKGLVEYRGAAKNGGYYIIEQLQNNAERDQ